MPELSGLVLETLWEDVELVLSRGVREGETALLVVAPASAQPSPVSLARLEHAYALRDELDPAWAARPLRLVRHRGRPMLLLEDPGGEPLARLLGRPREITSVLRVALGLGAAVGARDEAAGQDRRGALPDRRGRRGRPPPLPGGMGGARPHRPVPARRAGRAGPAADPRDALRPGARDRLAARFLRPCRGRRHAGAGAGVRLFRDRQVLGGQRAA